MKKLFLLLTALAMSFSATMYAVPYLPDAEDAASTYLFDEDGQIGGRNKAPMATTSYTFSANSTDFATLIQKASNENFAPYYLFALQLKKSGSYPIVDLYLGWNSSNNKLVNYGAITCVSPNTYSVLTSASQTSQIDKRIFSNSTFVSRVRTSSSNSVQFSNGTIKIEAGRHGYPYISTTADLYKNNTTKYNITAGDSRALTTTYTSCRVATDEERGKAVLYATEGTNTMTLIFSLENFDANIGIPAGTYTIGTDVKGGAYDEDGYTRWTFTSGTITITKNTNNLSMTTSSLKGQSSGSSFNCNLTITNKTPNKTFTPIICDAGLIGGGSNSPYWPFKVVGQNGDNQSPYFYAQYAYLSDITSGSAIYWTPVDATNNKLVVNNSTLTTWKQGFIEVDYTEDYEVMELYTGIMGANGTFYYVYVASNQVSNANGTNGFSMDYDNSSAFSATFSGCAIDEENSNETLKMIYGTGEANNKVTNLFFWVDDTKDGVVPSGRYPVRSTCVPNTLLLGCITSEGYINGSFSANSDYSNTWAMRTGAIEVVNVNETYYISTSSLANSKNQSMTFTMGTAPKTLTFNSDANGSVSASFNATNWGKTITDYAEGTAYPFFTGQTIVLTPTPADGYEFDSWSGGSPTDNGNGTYSITIGASNVSLTANFRAAGPSTHTVDFAVDGTNSYGTVSPSSITDVPDGATIVVDGNTITIKDGDDVIGSVVTATPTNNTAQYAYEFTAWKNGSTTLTGSSNTVTDDITIKANFSRTLRNYTVTVAKNNNDYGTLTNESDNVRVINNVPYGTVITTGTGENANKVTINGTTVTATTATSDAQYSYAFSGWTNGAATVTGNMTVTANFTRTVNTYDITWKSEDGTSTLDTDEAQAYGTATAYNGATTPTKTVTGYTYTFDGWTTEPNGAGTFYANGETPAVGGAATYYAHFTGGANTYTVTFAANGGSGTMADQAFTYGTAQNLRTNAFTGPAATVTYDYNGATGGNSKASETVYATFSGWLGSNSNTYTDEQEVNNLTTTNGATVTMTAQWEMLAEVTLPQPTKTGYTLYAWEGEVDGMNMSIDENNEWSFALTTIEPVTMTAQWNRIEYTITYGGLNGETNTNPDTYTIESEDINLVAPGTRDGYIFAGWKDESNNTITQIAKGSTGNRTLTATWNVKSSNIELCENCNDAHYNTFKANYNNETVNVTYPRQFAEGRWSTMCLPFSLNLAKMTANNMYGCVYEFKYATGNANVGSGVNLYFSNAKKIEAGKCYIVNANSALAEKTSFVFSGVTIDLSKDNGADLSSPETPEASVAAYNALPGYKSEGTIELVGTLRNGILMGTATGNKYMGLKENKIYYPNTDTGSTIWAYRGIFRSSEILDKESMQKMRIIVDGEDRGELIIDADGDILAPSDAQSRKFIENGVLYIEREGVIYDAQGKRIK